jgi:hypothetical protein
MCRTHADDEKMVRCKRHVNLSSRYNRDLIFRLRDSPVTHGWQNTSDQRTSTTPRRLARRVAGDGKRSGLQRIQRSQKPQPASRPRSGDIERNWKGLQLPGRLDRFRNKNCYPCFFPRKPDLSLARQGAGGGDAVSNIPAHLRYSVVAGLLEGDRREDLGQGI